MQDRNGKEIRVGEVVKIVNPSIEVPLYNYWIILGFLDQGLTVEIILQQYNSNEVRFINILDVERPFGD
jgi:hypothetical protein